ncbi:hypothetical protein JCM8547_005704 [Rhodosporidiobolus lusitaniae]
MPTPSRAPQLSLDTLPTSDSDEPLRRPRTPARRNPIEEQRRARVEESCGHLRLSPEGQQPAFELLVLGCGGGPIETNLSSFVVKPYSKQWTDGCTGLEGGSTIGALASLIERNPYAFEGFGLEIGVDAHELEAAEAATGGAGPDGADLPHVGVGREGGGKAAAKVWDLISCFAITHAHLDHIAGLIISSAACRPPPKPVWGIKRTIQNIERLMDGGVWPMLGGWDDSVTIGRAYHYKHIPTPAIDALPLSPGLSFHAFPLSHGLDPSFFHRKPTANGAGAAKKECAECYDSTAFFVREENSGKELLFFGDVEPDSISKRSLNLDIWKVAAPKIARGQLNIIFLECSYPTSQPAHQLYGHFSPPFILEEMVVLADLVKEERLKAGLDSSVAAMEPLRDVIVVIQHIKDDIFALPKPKPPSPPSSRPSSRPVSTLAPPAPLSANHTGEKDLPPLPPPKDGSKSAAPGPPPSLSKAFAARPSVLSSSQPAAHLMTMAPPNPSAPTRRPSSAGVFAFPSSPLATALSRNSYRQSVAADAGLLSSGFGSLPPALSGHSGWQNSFADAQRRASTPAPFGFGLQNPFAHPTGSPVGRINHSAPPGSALLDPSYALGGGRPISPGNVSPSRRSPGRSPTRSSLHQSQYAFPGTVEEEEEGSGENGESQDQVAELGERVSRKLDFAEEEEEEGEEEEEMIEETVHERIERELNELEEEKRTGVKFLIALQGMRLVF